jgi:hypothetical protein
MMTRLRLWQKRIIGALVIANVLTVALLVTLFVVTRLPGIPSPLARPTRVSVHRSETHLSPACRRRAVQMLSQVGLGGTATLADHTIQFDLVYPVIQDAYTEDVAQQVWKVFDVALALANGECDTFSRVDIVIETQGEPGRTRVYAAVDVSDLEAYHSGDLDEHAFIDQVHYRVEPADGG